MTLREILSAKGANVHTLPVSATLDDVVQKLVEHNCGSLLIVDESAAGGLRMLGIITERDILRACAARKTPLAKFPASDTMTTDVITGEPSDLIEDVLDLMTERRIRHLPILEEGRLVGLVSIGDVVKARQRQAEVENHYLKNYIQG
jgi:CBS domain-containing protein